MKQKNIYNVLLLSPQPDMHYPCIGEILINQTQDNKGVWDNCYYTTDINSGPFDAVIKINDVDKDVSIHCNPNNIISLHMEPYLGYYDNHQWMVRGNDLSRNIISHYGGVRNGKKQILMHGLQNWHIGKSYTELKSIKQPPNKKIDSKIVWITSNAMMLPEHRNRMYFAEYLKKYAPDLLDLYGAGFKPIDVKWDVFSNAKYIATIENHTNAHGWTEKLADAYLSYSLPLYYGPDNIDEYFPSDSYIRIDINNPEQALKTIKDAIQNNEWEKRLPAIIEARRRVLEEHNFAPWMTKFLNKTYKTGKYTEITIPRYKDTIFQKAILLIWLIYCKLSASITVYKIKTLSYPRYKSLYYAFEFIIEQFTRIMKRITA